MSSAPATYRTLQPRRKAMTVEECILPARRRHCGCGELKARIKDNGGVDSDPSLQQFPAVAVSNRQGCELAELCRPVLVNAVARTVIPKTCCVGGETVGLQALAEEDRPAAEPGMAEVPHLVAADQDGVVME